MTYQHQRKKISDKSSTHYRTWKKGKNWCYSFSILAALAGGVVLASQTVNADVTSPSAAENTTKSETPAPAVTENTPADDKTSPAPEKELSDASATVETSDSVPEIETADSQVTTGTASQESVPAAATEASPTAGIAPAAAAPFAALATVPAVDGEVTLLAAKSDTDLPAEQTVRSSEGPAIGAKGSFPVSKGDLVKGNTIIIATLEQSTSGDPEDLAGLSSDTGTLCTLPDGTEIGTIQYDDSLKAFTLKVTTESYSPAGDQYLTFNAPIIMDINIGTPDSVRNKMPFDNTISVSGKDYTYHFVQQWLIDAPTFNTDDLGGLSPTARDVRFSVGIGRSVIPDQAVFDELQNTGGASGAVLANTGVTATYRVSGNPRLAQQNGIGMSMEIYYVSATDHKIQTLNNWTTAYYNMPVVEPKNAQIVNAGDYKTLEDLQALATKTGTYYSLQADGSYLVVNYIEPEDTIMTDEEIANSVRNSGLARFSEDIEADVQATLDYYHGVMGNRASSYSFGVTFKFENEFVANDVKIEQLDNDGNVVKSATKTSKPNVIGEEGQTLVTVHYTDENGKILAEASTLPGWPAGNSAGKPATPDRAITPLPIPGYTYERLEGAAAAADGSSSVPYPAENVTDVTYIYTANNQNVIYNVIDDTTGENKETNVLFDHGGTGASLTKTQKDFQKIADDYKSQGYDIVGQIDTVPATFDSDDDVDQVINIHLTHHQTTATTTQEVTRTIHYVYENGDPVGDAAPDMPQKVTFTHTVVTDDVTGDPVSDTWTPDSDSFASVDSPEITNYTPDQTSVAGVSDLTYASTGQDVTVTYTANTEAVTDRQEVTRTIHYVYEDGSPVGEAAPDLTETTTFTRTGTKNLATGKTVWEEWTSDDASFDEITSPAIAGYTPDKPVVEAAAVAAEDEDITETVTYTADTQKIIYTVIDDTIGENLEENIDFDKGSTSDACTRSQDDLQGIADNYKDKGYDIVSVDTLPESFDADTATDQIVYIHLSHATEDSQESKEVSETIHYVYEDGSEAAPDKTDKVTFTRTNTTDKVTGEVISSTDWVAENDDTTFDAVTSPEIDGYTADKSTVEAVTGLTQDSEDTEVTVTYTKEAEEPAPPSEPTDETPTTPSSTPKATLTVQPTSQTAKKSVLPSTGDEERRTAAVAGGLAVLGAALLAVVTHLKRKKR
ncbi:hypothetical protein OfM2_00240 [Lactovum odontotermitis]